MCTSSNYAPSSFALAFSLCSHMYMLLFANAFPLCSHVCVPLSTHVCGLFSHMRVAFVHACV